MLVKALIKEGVSKVFDTSRHVDALDVPATTTPMGSGCLAPGGDGFFGDGGWLGGNAVIQALNAADVIRAVGCRSSSRLGLGRSPIMVSELLSKRSSRWTLILGRSARTLVWRWGSSAMPRASGAMGNE